ncbi:MAG: 50S ribosomal protein L35 [Candidatus Pacebacteria bacterium]|nr:50S ribosomal protein L35 [Candidatus Paceibacterota bacterium]
MPKLKTRKSAAKRIKRTATGKFRRYQANKRHILTKKSSNRKRRLRGDTAVDKTDQKRVRECLPYEK